MVRTYRVLLAGAEPPLLRSLRDAGFELVLLGGDADPATIVAVAVQEDADAVGVPGGEPATGFDDLVVFDTARSDAAAWLAAALDDRETGPTRPPASVRRGATTRFHRP